MRRAKIEICANSPESCIQAQSGGAHRVELCAGLLEGGTTPSYGSILAARQIPNVALHVIIRPRGGDFLYSPSELSVMLSDIQLCKDLRADGVVFGCLTRAGDVDVAAMRRLMDASVPLSVTFHRAFDVCRDPFRALEDLIALGVDRVLTSGQQPTAERGADLIAELVRRAEGRIIVMPGCGVSERNVAEIARRTGATEFHMSLRRAVQSEMEFRSEAVAMGGTVCVSEYEREVTDGERVRAVLAALEPLGL
jgi:copper homeostasis protein